MDLQAAAAVLPKWEPFIRRFVARDWLRGQLAVETDDIRQECRLRALMAIERLHREKPHLIGTVDEVKIVNRAIARCFADIMRKANQQSRVMDDVVAYTVVSGASWLPMATTTSVEDDYLADEMRRDLERFAHDVRLIMGEAIYADVIRVFDGDMAVGEPREVTLQSWNRRRNAIRAVKRQLNPTREQRISAAARAARKPRRPKMSKPAETLNDEDLARVALVYKQIHGAKVTSPARAHLLEKVNAVNSEPDGSTFPFPPCFGDGKQYDPADSSCSVECDFRIECAAIIPAHYDADIEAQLVQLKGGAASPKTEKPSKPAKEVKPPKPAKAKEAKPKEAAPAATPAAADPAPTLPAILPPVDLAMKALQTVKDLEKIQTAPAVATLPKTEDVVTKPSKKTAKPDKPKAAKAPKAKPTKAPKKAKPAKVKQTKAPKAKAKAKAPKAPREGKTVLTAPIALSTRAGVTRGKGYAVREDGTRYLRLPQGSAAELAGLPVGNKRERDYEGYRYYVRKVKDGDVVTTAGGVERKRDGVWRLEARAKLDDNGKPGAKEVEAAEGSLGVITRYITKSNAWSASRFWSVIPPLLDPKSDSFNPSKWKPQSIYAYGSTKAKGSKAKPKAKKAA